jgi:hypothetical protein
MKTAANVALLTWLGFILCCSSTSTGQPGDPCAHDADCGSGASCAFKVKDGCSAKGQCVSNSPGNDCPACISAPVCACDGEELFVYGVLRGGEGEGFATKPVAHVGSCSGPPSDGGLAD